MDAHLLQVQTRELVQCGRVKRENGFPLSNCLLETWCGPDDDWHRLENKKLLVQFVAAKNRPLLCTNTLMVALSPKHTLFFLLPLGLTRRCWKNTTLFSSDDNKNNNHTRDRAHTHEGTLTEEQLIHRSGISLSLHIFTTCP